MAVINRVLAAALVAVVIIAALRTPIGAEEGVLLVYNFAEGYTQDYQVKFNQEMEFGNFVMSQIVDMEVTEKCTGVEEGHFLMQFDFTKVEAARMQGDNMIDDPTGERLTGKAVSFKVDGNGETSELRPVGYVEGWEQMAKLVQALVDNWYAYLPNKAVAQGEGWDGKNDPKTEGGLKMNSNATYHFKEKKDEKGCECAKVEGETKYDVTGTQDTQMGTMNVEGGGKGDVEFYFCLKTSAIVRYKAKVEMKMEFTPEDGGDTTESSVGITMERQVK